MVKHGQPRGTVAWARLDPIEGHEQAGRRPVLIVSEGRFNARSGVVIVMPLTSQQPRVGAPFVLEVGRIAGKRGWVKPSQVRTISRTRLGAVIGSVSDARVEACLDALLQVCGRSPKAPIHADND